VPLPQLVRTAPLVTTSESVRAPRGRYAPTVERVTIRTTTLIRAVILTSLLGHWVANALFDRDQYAGAGSELLNRLDDPLLVQVALGLLVVTLLSIRDLLRSEKSYISAGQLPLTALLIGLQLLLFFSLESSERLLVDLFAGGETDLGIFGAGFVAELLVAVGSAILLSLVAEVTKRLFKFLRRIELRSDEEQGTSLSHGFTPPLGVLSGAGGVRAPPS
jgi:hypothetical protein